MTTITRSRRLLVDRTVRSSSNCRRLFLRSSSLSSSSSFSSWRRDECAGMGFCTSTTIRGQPRFCCSNNNSHSAAGRYRGSQQQPPPPPPPFNFSSSSTALDFHTIANSTTIRRSDKKRRNKNDVMVVPTDTTTSTTMIGSSLLSMKRVSTAVVSTTITPPCVGVLGTSTTTAIGVKSSPITRMQQISKYHSTVPSELGGTPIAIAFGVGALTLGAYGARVGIKAYKDLVNSNGNSNSSSKESSSNNEDTAATANTTSTNTTEDATNTFHSTSTSSSTRQTEETSFSQRKQQEHEQATTRDTSSRSSNQEGAKTNTSTSSEGSGQRRENIFSRLFGIGIGSRYYDGGFEEKMTRREAALILGIRESSTPTRIKEAHRKLLIQNHPDTGGSTFLAGKINEAKELLMKGKK